MECRKARISMALLRCFGGIHQYGFGLLLALKIYKVFIRPIMEFALAILP
jgi:hypothetical protein